MKTLITNKLQVLSILLIFGALMLSFTSCDSDEDSTDPIVEEKPTIKPKVETISSGFIGNGDVSIDAEGNLYVSEYGRFTTVGGSGSRLLKVNSKGIAEWVINGLTGPLGNEPGEDGIIYVNDDNNLSRGNLLKIDVSTGTKDTLASVPGWSSGMTRDALGNIYVANFSQPTVHKITPEGEMTIYAQDSRLAGCTGLEFDSKGNLVICNLGTANIYSINPKGEVSLIANIPDIVIQNFGIGYITIIDDEIYATGIAVNKIFKVTMDGIVTTIAGNGTYAQEDGELLEASFRSPNGIVSDKKNRILYVSEYTGAGGLRKIQL